ncbi:glycine zipper 2TM domain-containing protein [Sphingomonas montana]|uniref:glycine zipper 2TM domain-containing protein n=1 Tax=Sphingomonas montana TaxID=1843236 RepID=UPI00096C34AC|nr:glycine zipper 2TM domain-containing protein [Sphingomonas montana]
MFAKFLTAATLSLTAVAVVAPMPAMAQNWAPAAYSRYDDGQSGFQQVGWRDRRDGRYGRNGRGYRNNGYRNDRYGNNGYRGNQRCYDKGNGGLAIGGIAGGLLGNQVAGRGDRTLGTILGAGVGALAGRAVDKSDGRRC